MMDVEERILWLEARVNELQESFIQAQKNQVPITERTEHNSSDIVILNSTVETVMENVSPEWDPNGYDYYVSERVTYNGTYYRCIQSHKSQPSWAPDVAVSLWVAMSDPTVEWPEWVQPVGAHDAYMTGAKVSHNDKHWTSDVDNNVWEPGVYGWREAN